MEEEELKQPSSALKVEVAPMATPEKDKEDDGKVDPKRQKRKALCVKVAKQLLLNGTYMMLALCAGIRGPTLMDLQQVYGTDMKTISLSLVTASVGGVVGSFIAGLLMSKFPTYKYLITFEFVAGIAISTMLIPRLVHLWVFFLFMIVNGAHMAATHTALNVLCLDIWRGSSSGPAVHSLHSVFSVGAFLAPLASRPYLSVEIKSNGTSSSSGGGGAPRMEGGQEEERRVFLNSTVAQQQEVEVVDGAAFTESHIDVVYMFCGALLLAFSLGFLYVGAKNVYDHRRRLRKHREGGNTEPMKQDGAVDVVYSRKEKLIIAITTLAILCFIGGEFGIFNFLPAFAVKCELHLSKAQGVNILAVYFLCYALSRISCFFLTFCIPPRFLLAFVNILFIITGNIILLITAEKSPLFLTIGYGVLGFGSGSMFGNVLLWLEEHFVVTSRVTSLLAMAAGVGVNLAPLVVGQVIDIYPMILIYLQVSVTCVSVLVYGVVTWIGRDILKENQRRKKRLKEEKAERKQKEGKGLLEMEKNGGATAAAADEDQEKKPLNANKENVEEGK